MVGKKLFKTRGCAADIGGDKGRSVGLTCFLSVLSVLVLFFVGCANGTVGPGTGGSDDGDADTDTDTGECPLGCPTGWTCVDGTCQETDPCEGVECGKGSHCEDGSCVLDDPCEGVDCGTGMVCQVTIDGDPECVSVDEDADEDGHVAGVDCNDNDDSIYPGADEMCNGVNDSCDETEADGNDECPGYCCGAEPACQECCDSSQCGAGDWDCNGSFECECTGLDCDGECIAGGECCDASDCGGGNYSCTDNTCECDGVICDGTCYEGGQCCEASDCGGGDFSCSDHTCSCVGVVCDGTCHEYGECCESGDCGDGFYTCTSSQTCECDGLECGETCYSDGECCTATDCGDGSWSCSGSRTCSCSGYECGDYCYGSDDCVESCTYSDTGGWDSCGSRITDRSSGPPSARTLNLDGLDRAEICFTACDPSGWTLHVADSPSCNGYGGDGSDFSNDAELQLNGTTLALYASDHGGSTSLGSAAGFVSASGCSQRVVTVEDQAIYTSETFEVESEYSLRIDPPSDTQGSPDALWYLSFDGVVAGGSRTGSGITSAFVCLQ